ncbi:MAG: recombinase family protein [Gammaproteobacteria bacterium]|nr:recombinase family protein [Gammaproteobacteria bacterium]
MQTTPETTPLGERTAQLRGEGLTWERTVETLNSEGYESPNGGRIHTTTARREMERHTAEQREQDTTKAIGYIRVSTKDQADNGHSLDAQRAKIEAYCLAMGYELVGIEADEGVSGKVACHKRQGLSAAIGAAKDTGAVLVVVDADRIGRNASDVVGLVESAVADGWSIAVISSGINSATAAGRMTLQILASVGAFESAILSERTSRGLRQAQANGVKVGRPVSAS